MRSRASVPGLLSSGFLVNPGEPRALYVPVRLSQCRFLVCVAALVIFAPQRAAQQMEKLAHFADSLGFWEKRAETIRATILAGAHLAPLPERTPLHPTFANRRVRNSYSVEDIAFESVPHF